MLTRLFLFALPVAFIAIVMSCSETADVGSPIASLEKQIGGDDIASYTCNLVDNGTTAFRRCGSVFTPFTTNVTTAGDGYNVTAFPGDADLCSGTTYDAFWIKLKATISPAPQDDPVFKFYVWQNNAWYLFSNGGSSTATWTDYNFTEHNTTVRVDICVNGNVVCSVTKVFHLRISDQLPPE